MKAQLCRNKHKAIDGPKVDINYWIRSNGAAKDVKAETSDGLSKCLVKAVESTRFVPRLDLEKKYIKL